MSENGHDSDRRRIASVTPCSDWPPRLAVFTHRLDLGGAQLYLQEVLRHLLRNGDVRSCLVVSEWDGILRAELEQLGATVHVTDYPVRSERAYESRHADLSRLLRDHGAQVAIANTMGAGIGADVAQRLGIPVVWAIHESYIPEDFWTAAYGDDGIAPEVRSSVLRAFARAPAIVFVADATRAAYSAIGDRARLVTIPYGIPLEEIAEFRRTADRCAIRQAAGIPMDATVLLCVGTVEPRKAQAALVVAFAEVAPEFPEAVLVLVGDTGSPYAEGVRELAQRLGMADRVRLEAVSPDPYPWYAAADAFVMASDVESMPRALLEAMAFHLPVAAAEVWGVPELVTDGCDGLLFPPRDIGAAADALRRVLGLSSHARARLAEMGARTVEEKHDVRGYVDAYRTLLHGLAVDPTAVPGSILRS
jgi:glycosyltransferase involved in cell wall biosynthesis